MSVLFKSVDTSSQGIYDKSQTLHGNIGKLDKGNILKKLNYTFITFTKRTKAVSGS